MSAQDVVSKATASSNAMLFFNCPGCQMRHYVIVHPEAPAPRWAWNGSYEHPTFAPSILARGAHGSTCHSFVADGQIQFLTDCTHALAGQTVPLMPVAP